MGDDGLITGIDTGKPLTPDNFAGAGVFESGAQVYDSLGRAVKEGDWGEFGMNVGALTLDGFGMMIDPLGSLATAGIGWLIEHISFLREGLDKLAGDGDKIKEAVAGWNKAAAALDGIAQAQHDAVENQVRAWEQAAADAFRQSQGRLVRETLQTSRTCVAVAESVASAGTLTATVRGMIRDLVAVLVWEIIRNAAIALASSVVSFGSSVAAFAAWAVGRAAVVLGKITQLIAKLLRAVTRILSRMKGALGALGDALEGLGRFGRGTGAGGTTRAAGAQAADAPPVRFQGVEEAGKRMEDWGNARPTPGDVGSKVADAGRQFGRAYSDAGKTWERATKNVTVQRAKFGEAAVDAYTPFKPLDRGDGTPMPHSVPSVTDGAFQTKLAADYSREAAKQDELENEGREDPAFKRRTGYLDR
ncbi:hypothetical protein ACFV4N_10625 [Actinosynnema sp. NPDC059797]